MRAYVVRSLPEVRHLVAANKAMERQRSVGLERQCSAGWKLNMAADFERQVS